MQHHADHLSDHDLMRDVDWELPVRRQAAAAAHLAGCALCRKRRAQLDRVAGVAADLVQAAPVAPELIDMSRRRLESRLSDMAVRSGWRHWLAPMVARTPQWTIAGAALVAALLLVRVAGPLEPSSALGGNVRGGEREVLPIASITPGATWNVGVEELCARGGREQRPVSEAVRREVLRAYGMDRLPSREYELDYLITPELGGAPDVQNLWPQRYGSRTWNAHVKDQLERLLPELVCGGTLPLETAQHEIAADWIAAYKKYFRTDLPVQMDAARIAGGVWESPEDDAITYPIWRSANAPALTLISFSAAR